MPPSVIREVPHSSRAPDPLIGSAGRSLWALGTYTTKSSDPTTRFYGASNVSIEGEEIDPETCNALGNFPQAFTHIGLINAALTISDAEGSEKAARLEDDVSGERPN